MMTQPVRTLDRVTEKIEKAQWLDPAIDSVAAFVRRLLPRGPVGDAVSGRQIAHPLHPPLTAVPVGSWVAAAYLDLFGGKQHHRSAQRLIGLGNLAAVPTAVAGANDWADTLDGERRLGFVHALVNDVALTLNICSWLARRRGRHVAGISYSLAGAAAMTTGAWLGGHLSYAIGVGVDTTAFQHLPRDWTDVAAEVEVVPDKPLRCDAAGVPIMLTRRGVQVVALADRCPHRGGPLHEGEVGENTITCPWHGSRFCLEDGAVAAGPATRPVVALETRTVGGRVEVRHTDEPRALRTRPVGV
jgi:nitrite reductase/ring-hydroxylating ferredoxin subunit/uncharacterized membrane protein